MAHACWVVCLGRLWQSIPLLSTCLPDSFASQAIMALQSDISVLLDRSQRPPPAPTRGALWE